MISLSNDRISITVAAKGAELQSLYSIPDSLEYLWSGDPQFWGKKSPVLFPIVGGLKDNSYTYEGKSYSLPRHGFARDREFSVAEQSSHSLRMLLTDNVDTSKQYPFHFNFFVQYSLQESTVAVTYIVENTGTTEMLFSVGGHPAFKVPIAANTSYEDYYLLFENEEQFRRYPLSAQGLIENTTLPILTDSNKLHLNKELFYKDALVFKHLKSKHIAIASDQTTHGLKVVFDNFPYLGIWAAKDADFVCIEPWCGIADSVEANGKLREKEGINSLKAGETFERTFTITVF